MLKILIFYFTMIVGTFVGFRYRILELFAAHACRKHVCVRTHTHTFILSLLLLISEVITGKILLIITAEIDN